ncbi:unnamed protein product [Didymodactylos carnosus]|uniref:Uncharacterized protein n=1 Tax=Didymodactylos carnosus TaxID=1234261 RepID=A0A8S2FPS7_9BILA|nr:unnamed protein product [Didymodactylos carnosus]CAF4315773.1 unnamed protein product [Didymodactylos carnosus]
MLFSYNLAYCDSETRRIVCRKLMTFQLNDVELAFEDLKDDSPIVLGNFKFNEFVKETLGGEELDIFKVQSIRSVHSLLRTKNVFGIFDLNCDELINIQERCCLKLKDNSYVIKQGIISSIAEFVDTLKALEQKHKISLKQKQLNLPITNALNETSSSITTNNTQILTTTIPILTQLVPLPSQSPMSIYNVQQKYLEVITNAVDKWCNHDLNGIVIKPDDDYMINLVPPNDKDVVASIKCGCGTRILIPLRVDSSTFHLSSYYRHLNTGRCRMIRNKQKQNNVSKDLEQKDKHVDEIIDETDDNNEI